IINDKHCFEVYGFDVMIDKNLRPWLLEINASPSLTCTTVSDRILKHTLLLDTFEIVLHPDFPEKLYKDYKFGPERKLGNYEILIDEMNETTNVQEVKRAPKRRFK